VRRYLHRLEGRLPQVALDRRAAVLAAISGVLVAAGVYAFTHQPLSAHQVASAIERGMVEARMPPADAEAVEDERLTGDANEAGYRWAERRGLATFSDCPTYSKAFRDGCDSYVREQREPLEPVRRVSGRQADHSSLTRAPILERLRRSPLLLTRPALGQQSSISSGWRLARRFSMPSPIRSRP
jgi:hypothetical protein